MTAHIDDRLARRNALILAVAQSIVGGTAPVMVTLGGLAGYFLLGDDKSLATLPVTAYIVGTAIGTIPAAMLMQSVGRRNGFVLGTILAMIGGAIAVTALIKSHFWLLCLGHAAVGLSNAFVQQYRFAAADTASTGFKPKAISWVMIGGIGAAIIGPQTVIFSKDLLLPIPFAGAYIGVIVLAIIGAGVLLFLNIPPTRIDSEAPKGRALFEIITQLRFIVAVICAIISYALMSFVMTAAPLAMIACNHSEADAALGIQWHVLAMYGPSFFTGNLIQRFGREAIVFVGLILLGACSLVALAGIDLAHFWAALVLLGIGWNFGFIGATAMVADTYHPHEKGTVQGVNDFLIFGCVAFASFMSGNLLNDYGWDTVLMLVFPAIGVAIVVLGSATLLQRRRPA